MVAVMVRMADWYWYMRRYLPWIPKVGWVGVRILAGLGLGILNADVVGSAKGVRRRRAPAPKDA